MRAPSVASPSPWSGVWLPLLLGACYLTTRLLNLGLLPMVSDEGTYITWGVRALQGRGLEDWLASLEDGKQPLLAWLMPPFLTLVPDRLVAGRLVSVCCGLANLALLVALGRRLVSPAVGWIAAGLYVVAPIALLHDRMALYDSLVTTGALVVLLATVAWADDPSWRRTLWLGLAMGGALLTKLSALFFLALVPLAVALWRPAARPAGSSPHPPGPSPLRSWWRLAQAYFLGAAVYSVLYASPIVDNIQDGNFQRYSLTAGEVLALPWRLWGDNLRFIVEAAGTYLGWPLSLAALAGLALALRPGQRGLRLAALWSLVPLLLFVLTAKLIYSRYFVFCFVVLLIPAGAALLELLRLARARALRSSRPLPRALTYGALGVLLLALAGPGIGFALPLLTDPARAPWMNDRRYITDRFQYVESNYAGYGLPEIVGYIRERAQQGPVVVLARDTTGMPRDGMTAYLQGWPNVAVGFVPERETIEEGLRRRPDAAYRLAVQGADVFYLLSDAPGGEQERRFRRLNPEASLVLDLPKPGNHSRFQLYRTRWQGGAGDVFLEPPPRFGEAMALRGYRLSATSVRAGETLVLTLYWEAAARPRRDFTVFNHVTALDGTLWGQKDAPPGGGPRPTSRWRPGEAVADRHEITIKPDTPAGTYDLFTGLYELETLQRLPVQGDGDPLRRVQLARIEVLAPE
jgi:4-amino-4-deoxy-L-arabinose transferase-like glycosyltransferase